MVKIGVKWINSGTGDDPENDCYYLKVANGMWSEVTFCTDKKCWTVIINSPIDKDSIYYISKCVKIQSVLREATRKLIRVAERYVKSLDMCLDKLYGINSNCGGIPSEIKIQNNWKYSKLWLLKQKNN